MQSKHSSAAVLAAALLIAIATGGVQPRAADAIRQTHSSHDGATSAGVTADRIVIGAEYFARRTDLAKTLIVAARQTVEALGDATYDYIEVAGTLKVSRTHDTTLRFTHLVVLPGGVLDVGTQADPIPCDRKVELIVRDVPIDTGRDPFQWGNGLVNFGHQTRVGCNKSAWMEATGSIASGSTTVMLESAPSGWQAGDELLIPDTAPPPVSTRTPRRESTLTIAAINGTQLELSKPVDFSHDTITDPNGAVVLRPRVANLTRNIVVRSENAAGTPGHTADVGQTASWDIRYNQLTGLGRTTRQPFDDTVAGTHIGVNQRGKYAEHHHHVQSAPTSADVGNVYIGHPKGKWGLVVHVTSDTLIERNIAVAFPGAGFVTEDGYEARNVFRKNLAAYNLGAGGDPGSILDGSVNVTRNCPGCEGTGFWFRGVLNTFEANEGWNNLVSGMNLFNQMQPAGQSPGGRGGKPDTPLKHFNDRPILMTGNVVAANAHAGLEMWGVSRFPDVNLIAANNGSTQVNAIISDGVEVYLRNPKVICRVGSGATGIHSSEGYVGTFELEQGGQIAGCAFGIRGSGSLSGMDLKGTALQNEVNIDSLPRRATFDSVVHLPLGEHPHRYILFSRGPVWNGTDPLPTVGTSYWIPQRGSRYVVKNWQGTGKDYLLFYRHSLGSNPAWYSASFPHNFNTPVEGLSMQESWERYGLAYGGDVVKESEAVPLDGLVDGLAREGLAVRYAPPRAVITHPTMRENAVVQNDGVHISALLTGDPNGASRVMMVSVDGDRPTAYDKGNSDDASFVTTHVSPGTHEVKVWRTQKDKPSSVIPESEFTARYCIGACPGIPHGHITLSDDALTFTGTSSAPALAPKTVTLSNSGVVAMTWIARTDSKACDVSPYGGRLAAGASTTLSIIVRSAPDVASAPCKVLVRDHNADNSPQTINVIYNTADRPDF